MKSGASPEVVMFRHVSYDRKCVFLYSNFKILLGYNNYGLHVNLREGQHYMLRATLPE